MIKPSFEKECIEILETLDKYFPKSFDGKDSIEWLHKYSSQKKQDEWAAFFFEDYCFFMMTKILGGWKGPRITSNKRFDYQRDHVWDFKLESIKDARGKKVSWIILNDVRATHRVVQQESGIGYIIAIAEFDFDHNNILRRWRDKKEGRVKERHNPRILKKSGKIIVVYGIFIKNMSQITKGLKDGWLGEFKQGKNAGGESRFPKYKIRLDKVPPELIIKL